MIPVRCRQSAVLFAFLASLGMGLGDAGTLVLCLEEDRVAVEVGKCGPGKAVQDPCRAPCVDIPLATAGSRTPIVLADQNLPGGPPAAPAALPSRFLPVFASLATGAIAEASAISAPPILTFLRTVVLLI
ncbi:MAG: hypothetical protein HYY13_12550 [Nitrospirae bacterium]|nr:hypothetical protein [Nitrospirota bacterium]